MKYIVLLCDGMADYPVEELGGKTPMEAARKPHMDALAAQARVGLVKTVDDALSPGSDVANLSVMGYDPLECYSGRSPLEAASIGIDMADTDVAFRCNLVTLSGEAEYEDKTLVDYCADDISTQEARALIGYLKERLDSERYTLYSGVSYRHCLIWHGGDVNICQCTPPHDITGQKIKGRLPDGAPELLAMMKRSYQLLEGHPVNLERIRQGKRPANSMWLWGQGTRPRLAPFADKFGLKGSVISAVDLLKGIGKCAKMSTPEVEGATGYIDTNFTGKMEAALEEFQNGSDFVYIHVEAPDECGHRHEIQNKVKAIELIDSMILGPLLDGMEELRPYKIMILPDHPTPLATKTHARDAVPFLIYDSEEKAQGVSCFTEASAKAAGDYVEKGCMLIRQMLNSK